MIEVSYSRVCVIHVKVVLDGGKLSESDFPEHTRHQDRALKLARIAAEGHNGRIWQHEGDSILAMFQNAEEGLKAVRDMQERVSKLPPIFGSRPKLRAGIETGRVIQYDNTLGGAPVFTAGHLMRVARPGQCLASGRLAMDLSPPTQKMLHLVQTTSSGSSAIFEVSWEKFGENLGAKVHPGSCGLNLEKDGKQYLVGVDSKGVHLGRDQTCDLVVKNTKVSRRHAWIGYIDGNFVIVDKSSNGTYVTDTNGEERMLRRGVLVLSGKGIIALGHSTRVSSIDTLAFDVRC